MEVISVVEFVLIEQFMGEVPEDLAIWLRERKPDSLKATADLADDYMLARR